MNRYPQKYFVAASVLLFIACKEGKQIDFAPEGDADIGQVAQTGDAKPVSVIGDNELIGTEVPEKMWGRAVHPAAPDPLISEEFGIDVPSPQQAWGDQGEPAVGRNGDTYLVVWEDFRSGRDDDIVGARVDADTGLPLDPCGIVISTVASTESNPRVDCDGTYCLVVWTDRRNVSDVYGARVRMADGVVMEPGGIRITTETTGSVNQSSPDVVNVGDRYFVVWGQEASNMNVDIYGGWVNMDGTVADPDGFPIFEYPESQNHPEVAYAASSNQLMVIWQDDRDMFAFRKLYGAILSGDDGTVLYSDILVSGGDSSPTTPDIASNGSSFYAIWGDSRNGTNKEIRGTRISSTGNVSTPTGKLISSAQNGRAIPQIGFNGTNYMAVWEDNRGTGDRGIWGSRIGSSGTVLDTGGIEICQHKNGEQEVPGIGCGDEQCLAVWVDSRSGTFGYDIYGTRISSTGRPLNTTGTQMSGSAIYQRLPETAFGDGVFFVAWQEHSPIVENRYDIYGTRISASSGNILNANGIRLYAGEDEQSSNAVAFSNGNFLTAWLDKRDSAIDTVRIRASTGAVLDSPPDRLFMYGGITGGVSAAAAGNIGLVSWVEADAVVAARLQMDTGTVLDVTPITVKMGGSNENYFSTAASTDGTDFLVAWGQVETGGPNGIRAARIRASDGMVLDEEGIDVHMVPYDLMPSGFGSPDIAFDGSNYMIVWEHDNEGNYQNIYGARVGTDGIVLDSTPFAVAEDSIDEGLVSISYDGIEYVLAWEHGMGVGEISEIWGSRIGSDGAVSVTPFVLSNEAFDIRYPVLASDGEGNSLLTYSRYVVETDVNGHRIRSRFIYRKSDGATCSDNNECISGICVDDVCCDATCGGGDTGDCQACSVAEGATTDGVCEMLSSSHVCRGADADCDLAEYCTGSALACPADDVRAAGSFCGSGPGPCHAQSTCDDAGTCVMNYYEAGVECNDGPTICSGQDTCDGEGRCLSNHDASGTPCGDGPTECSAQDSCDGNGNCASNHLDAGTACGDATDAICDHPDSCDGNGDCETNFESTSTVCRASMGPCDVEERCDGDGSCPTTDLKSTEICRPSSGLCDPVERCDGILSGCPTDVLFTNGETCDDGSLLTQNDQCVEGAVCSGENISGTCGAPIPAVLPFVSDDMTRAGMQSFAMLSSSCAGADTGAPEKVYAVQLEAGQKIAIRVVPIGAMNPLVNILEDCASGAVCVGSEDEGGSSSDEYLEFTSFETRAYFIVVRSAEEGGTGAFHIEMKILDSVDTDDGEDNGDNGDSAYIADTGDTADTADTVDTADTADTADTGDTAGTADTADNDTFGATDTSADTNTTSDLGTSSDATGTDSEIDGADNAVSDAHAQNLPPSNKSCGCRSVGTDTTFNLWKLVMP